MFDKESNAESNLFFNRSPSYRRINIQTREQLKIYSVLEYKCIYNIHINNMNLNAYRNREEQCTLTVALYLASNWSMVKLLSSLKPFCWRAGTPIAGVLACTATTEPPIAGVEGLNGPPIAGVEGLNGPPIAGVEGLDGCAVIDEPPVAAAKGLDGPPISAVEGPPIVAVEGEKEGSDSVLKWLGGFVTEAKEAGKDMKFFNEKTVDEREKADERAVKKTGRCVQAESAALGGFVRLCACAAWVCMTGAERYNFPYYYNDSDCNIVDGDDDDIVDDDLTVTAIL
jgi:hypothetical protein